MKLEERDLTLGERGEREMTRWLWGGGGKGLKRTKKDAMRAIWMIVLKKSPLEEQI